MELVEKIKAKNNITLYVEMTLLKEHFQVSIKMEDYQNCLLHWGLRHNNSSPWQIPLVEFWPEGSHTFENSALQSPFICKKQTGEILIRIANSMNFSVLEFVLYFPEENRWDNNSNQNYRISIPQQNGEFFKDPILSSIANEIISREMSNNSWTLMHRFNLCYDLLDRTGDTLAGGMALIYVWLRFSAIRQLDWQRNYNTKPRELAHALDRLTIKLANRYVQGTAQSEFIRLILSSLGRGSEGQRVRDEILHIMHRHHIKEVSCHFMEEWHQKLHNNTTPDDIIICEAYLEFMDKDGNLNSFYRRLKKVEYQKKDWKVMIDQSQAIRTLFHI